MNIIEAQVNTDEIQIGIIASQYNDYIVSRLLSGAEEALLEKGIGGDQIDLVRVPGAFEIPVAVRAMAETGKYDAIITLGAVIRGETPHFDYICTECSRGINEIAIEFSLPVVFGVLTVDSSEQAMDRSGSEESNKGAEAADTAVDMINAIYAIYSEGMDDD